MADFDLQQQYDSLLTLFDELLKDESPLSQNEDSLLVIDDNLLQLKLWGNAIRAKDGTLQKTSLDKYFALSVQQMLQEIQDHLHYVERVSSSGELATRETELGISEALNELSSSVDRLTATVQTFQAFLAYSQGETFLQKRLAESEDKTSRNRSLLGGLKSGSHGIASKLASEMAIPSKFSQNSLKSLTCAVRGIPAKTTRSMVEENFNLQISPESPCIAHSVVDDTQGNSCVATVTFRRERKGLKRSCEILKKEFNGSHWLGKTSTISVVDDFMGLTPLSGAADAKIHVYFVHGLGGHAFRTWCSDPDDDITKMTAWPRDFLPKAFFCENINARVFTLGYNVNSVRRAAPNAIIQSTAEDLLAHLIADRSISSQTRPSEIHFVCHSLGGLVVSEALIMALYQDEEYVNKSQYRDLFMNGDECLVKGICFMGTPFRGSGQANLLAPFVEAVKGLDRLSGTNDEFLGSLRENNQLIEVPTIVQRFKTIAREKNMRLLIGCEEIPVVGSELTVTYESAVSIFKDIAIAFRIPANHREMVQFDGFGRKGYKQLEGLIMGMILYRLTLQTPTVRPQLSPGGEARQLNRDVRGQFELVRSFNTPFRLHAEPISGIQPHVSSLSEASRFGVPYSDPTVPSVSADDPYSNLGAPRRSKSDFRTKSTNTDDDIFNRLKIFDTVFIIDDTGSMGLPVRMDDPDGPNRWEVTKDALEHVADIAASHDEDGIDIRFLKATEFDENKIGSGERVVEILEHIDVADENHGGGTEFKNQLESVIRSYLTDYEDYIDDTAEFKRSKGRAGMGAHPKEPKFLNVIVITDGQADDEEEVEEYIVKVAKKLDGMDAPKNYIGIQFIQIGDDDRATSFLQRLDDELKTQSNPIRDIVDTTPYFHSSSESNVPFSQVVEHKLKLLLGGGTKRYDNMQNNNLGR